MTMLTQDSPPVASPVDDKGGKLTTLWLRWFRLLWSNVNSLLGSLGGQYINNPCGQFQSRSNQAITSANTLQKVTLDTTAFSQGVSISSSKITVAQPGIYAIDYQLQIANPTAQIQEFWVWIRKNGTDIAYSADKYDAPNQHGASDGYLVALSTFYIRMAANDYVEIYIASTSNSVNLETYAPSASPFVMPGVPSVDLNVWFVSS